jgi:RimJ/RimL family protein N-acetyltransferase
LIAGGVRGLIRFNSLSTERLLIRNLVPGDAEAFFAYKCRPECVRFQFWRPETIEEIKRFIDGMQSAGLNEPGAWLQLAVCLKESNAMIGDAGLHFSPDDDRQVEIGYTLSPDYQHRGYATEAVKAILDYLFSALGKHRVTASVDPRNTPSAAVLERLGFRKEAHFRKSVYIAGEWCDDCVYAMLEEDRR